MIDEELLEAEDKMDKAVSVAREDFATIRTGRPSPTAEVAIHDLARLTRIFGVLTRHGFHQFVGRKGLVRFLGDRLIPPDDPDMAVLDAPEMAARRFRRVLEELEGRIGDPSDQ